MKAVNKQQIAVKNIKNGVLFPNLSDIAPIIGENSAANSIDPDKAQLYRISSPRISTVTHKAKYREITFIAKIVFAKSYIAQEKIVILPPLL